MGDETPSVGALDIDLESATKAIDQLGALIERDTAQEQQEQQLQ